jgi:uncharacterized membrane-anchored protein
MPVGRSTVPRARVSRTYLAVKVPEITLLFWIVKVVTTGMGEATSDFLGEVSIPLAGIIGIFGFAGALRMQFRAERYVPAVYWFTVVMVAVFGTMVADGMHVVLGVPYAGSTTCYAVLLAIVFWRWRRSEGTLSIHSITTRRRETYYWLTVLATFALGTAAGDLTATSLNLGFFDSAILFAVAIVVPAVAWWRFRLDPIAAFWIAYVLTRPLGASVADWLGKPPSLSGVGIGDDVVSLTSSLLIVVLVWILAASGRDVQAPGGRRGDPEQAAGAVPELQSLPDSDAVGLM